MLFRSNQDSMQFEDFWNAYDLKKARPIAEKAFQKALKLTDFETIMAGVRQYKAELARTGRLQAHPTTWLNRERWADEPEKVQSNEADRGKNNGDYTNGTMATQALADIAREALLAESGYDWEAHNTRQGRAACPQAGAGGLDGTFTHGAASGHPGANFEDADAKQKSGRLAGGDADADCRHR